jgi:hypothetical protein
MRPLGRPSIDTLFQEGRECIEKAAAILLDSILRRFRKKIGQQLPPDDHDVSKTLDDETLWPEEETAPETPDFFQPVWEEAARLCKTDPSAVRDWFIGNWHAHKHFLTDKTFTPHSFKVTLNPESNLLTISINFGAENTRIIAIARDIEKSSRLTREVHFWMKSENLQQEIARTIVFDKPYSWDEVLDLLARLFKVENRHMEAAFGLYTQTFGALGRKYGDQFCFQSDGYESISLQPIGEEIFALLSVRNGILRFDLMT